MEIRKEMKGRKRKMIRNKHTNWESKREKRKNLMEKEK